MTAFAVTPPVRALIRKELREYRHHRMIVLTATVLPVVFLILPIVNLAFYDSKSAVGGVNVAVGQAMFCFFLAPVIIPATMAAFAVIGERDQGTLEPLMTLPLSDREFLAGKLLAIVGPTVAASFTIYAGYMVFVLAVVHGEVRGPVLDWTWPFGFVLLTPALATFSTLVGMAFSSRAKDIRVAEHLSGLVLLPLMLPVMLIVTRTVPANLVTWLAFCGVLVVADALLFRVALRAFDRERAISGT
jgi:ABC-2 type transport system permease protein